MKAFWCFVAGLALMSAATEMPEMEMTYVDDVDAEGFDAYMKDAEGLLLLFYAPWCNHCRRFMPVFDIAAGEIKKNTNIKIARINGGEEANEPICDRYNLQSFPTVMYITGDKAVEYKGRRTPESILRFVKLAREPTLVDIADKTAYDAFVAENEYAVFGVFGDVEDGLSSLLLCALRCWFWSVWVMTLNDRIDACRCLIPPLPQSQDKYIRGLSDKQIKYRGRK